MISMALAWVIHHIALLDCRRHAVVVNIGQENAGMHFHFFPISLFPVVQFPFHEVSFALLICFQLSELGQLACPVVQTCARLYNQQLCEGPCCAAVQNMLRMLKWYLIRLIKRCLHPVISMPVVASSGLAAEPGACCCRPCKSGTQACSESQARSASTRHSRWAAHCSWGPAAAKYHGPSGQHWRGGRHHFSGL